MLISIKDQEIGEKMGIEQEIQIIRDKLTSIEFKLNKLLELNIGNQISNINDKLNQLYILTMEKDKPKDRQDKEKAIKQSLIDNEVSKEIAFNDTS